MRTVRRWLGGMAAQGAVAAAMMAAPAGAARAQEAGQVFNPSEFVLLSRPAGRKTLMATRAPEGGAPPEVALDLDIDYVDRLIRNPDGGPDAYDSVRLRGYVDANAVEPPGPHTPLVGPTIAMRPGQTLRITLNNKLPADPTCGIGGGSGNTPHCFNGTNLHTHGLWVNPSGNGDNVLISIRPGVSFQYEYNLPPDHPAGTFWYHPHLHGSTALQVSSGMAGAIVVRGDRTPQGAGTGAANGDIDTLLMREDGAPVTERVLVLQQIQYACRDQGGAVQTGSDGAYVCNQGQVGGIEGYDQFGPGTWPKSGRRTSINGQVLGALAAAEVGAVERWRLIHAGVRDTIAFELREKTGDEPHRALGAGQDETWIARNCGDAVPYHVIAQDGLTMARAQPRSQATLQPGYRVDALVVFPRAGDYCVIDAASPGAGSVNEDVPGRQLLGVVTAAGGAAVDGDPGERLAEWLIAAARRAMPADVVEEVAADLADGLRLDRFVPHADVAEDEVTGAQELVFNIDVSKPGAAFFQIDGQPYEAGRIDRTLAVGGVDEWTLRSDFVSHPFHIHVNPFQVVRILDHNGVDVSAEGATDGSGAAADPQYPGLKGVWKDTLWVKNNGQPYTIVVRTRYQRYIGDFVLHCHILDHEDQGMMQNVRIALPDGLGTGGAVYGHH